ncbi:hypothetical protein BL254_10785 [Protofrankia sp. BMG5.30]|uniref:Uncharacterized protein n=1 Tax=Protofrankia coriariae TaxID=1562887 RepID=A0ABR5F765_9ACTN|nr:hypothetical protein FrCorBMG51_04650 [Protofrankia coriariae]ONH35441.1 hypothetical protein BL254_10785 [Protofrankia sp. BMG5.30]
MHAQGLHQVRLGRAELDEQREELAEARAQTAGLDGYPQGAETEVTQPSRLLQRVLSRPSGP